MIFVHYNGQNCGVVHFVSALCVEKVKSHVPAHAISFRQ